MGNALPTKAFGLTAEERRQVRHFGLSEIMQIIRELDGKVGSQGVSLSEKILLIKAKMKCAVP